MAAGGAEADLWSVDPITWELLCSQELLKVVGAWPCDSGASLPCPFVAKPTLIVATTLLPTKATRCTATQEAALSMLLLSPLIKKERRWPQSSAAPTLRLSLDVGGQPHAMLICRLDLLMT